MNSLWRSAAYTRKRGKGFLFSPSLVKTAARKRGKNRKKEGGGKNGEEEALERPPSFRIEKLDEAVVKTPLAFDRSSRRMSDFQRQESEDSEDIFASTFSGGRTSSGVHKISGEPNTYFEAAAAAATARGTTSVKTGCF